MKDLTRVLRTSTTLRFHTVWELGRTIFESFRRLRVLMVLKYPGRVRSPKIRPRTYIGLWKFRRVLKRRLIFLHEEAVPAHA